MLGAVACFATMAAFVKQGRAVGMSTTETMVYRMAPGLLWIAVELRRTRAPWRPRRKTATRLRTLFGVLAMAGSFYAVSGLTLLQHTILHLLQPVFVSILAPLLLRERLRGAALAALALALAGALVAIRPDRAVGEMATMSWRFGLVGLAAAVASALAHITVRLATGRLGGRSSFGWLRYADEGPPDPPETVVLHFTLWGSALALAAGVATGDFRGLPPTVATTEAIGLIAGMAGFGVLGQLLMSRAYAKTHAPLVAVVAYAAIPISIGLDALLWGTPVSVSGAIGTVLMVVAGALLARAR
ncbi:MAG: hypothetical protein D6705_10655 [Deltaproteobacteria bacterium]|nr:MAG: hypothetical protein D6705_10655 [Deltaproteobacteria bacterium]